MADRTFTDCAGCGKPLSLRDEFLGRGTCRKCADKFWIDHGIDPESLPDRFFARVEEILDWASHRFWPIFLSLILLTVWIYSMLQDSGYGICESAKDQEFFEQCMDATSGEGYIP